MIHFFKQRKLRKGSHRIEMYSHAMFIQGHMWIHTYTIIYYVDDSYIKHSFKLKVSDSY